MNQDCNIIRKRQRIWFSDQMSSTETWHPRTQRHVVAELVDLHSTGAPSGAAHCCSTLLIRVSQCFIHISYTILIYHHIRIITNCWHLLFIHEAVERVQCCSCLFYAKPKLLPEAACWQIQFQGVLQPKDFIATERAVVCCSGWHCNAVSKTI